MSSERAWTAEEETLLKDNFPSASLEKLSDTLGRSVSSIEGKARRMGLRKSGKCRGASKAPSDFSNPFDLMTRDDAIKLDKIDLLRINWSLFEMYRKELNNPNLTKAERHRLMNALSNHTSTINGVMKGSEDELGDEGDDIKTKFLRLNLGDGKPDVRARRIRIVLEGVRNAAKQRRT